MPDVRRILPVLRDQAAEGSPNATEDTHVISNHNRWSRTVFDFKDVAGDAWCELNFQIAWHQEEDARAVQGFASLGVDFLTEDGSSIDFAYVPGLSRAQIDPHCHYLAGPAYFDQGTAHIHSSRMKCAFFVPAPTRHLTVTIRSWRNSQPFTISDFHLLQAAQSSDHGDSINLGPPSNQPMASASRRTWQDLGASPQWQSYAVVPGHPLIIRGQLINWVRESDGTLVRVVFRDAQGEQLAPPYEGVSTSTEIGAFIDIPVHRQTRRFTLELTPPPQAAKVELGFQASRGEALISLPTPLEVSAGSDLLLENILGEDKPASLDFLEAVYDRFGSPPVIDSARISTSLADQFIDRESLGSLFTFHDRLRTVQQGESTAIAGRHLSLCGHEPWPLPETFGWTEDPYQSQAWRLEFQSLAWLLDLARNPELGGLARAVDIAISWAQSNPWEEPRDLLSAYPSSVAVRAEVYLQLLALIVTAESGKSIRHRQKLFAEIIRYGFALSEIVSQNVFSYSIIQLHTACTLLAISRAVPRFPIAPYWTSIALNQLRSGFDQLTGDDGSFIEQSLHHSLEIISIGLLLNHNLEDMTETRDFREHLTTQLKDSLKVVVGITDPSGMLPPFGDMLSGHHHASWLRRLISGYGRSLLSDSKLAEELSYPTGPRTFISEAGGIAVFRHYEREPRWSYLCASFSEQRNENSHFDCSSFIYTARGIRWITDAGGARFHDSSPARHYLTSSRAHNVAAPDGCEQSSGTGWIKAKFSLKKANIISIGTNVYGPMYDHARTIIGLDNLDAVAIFDRFRNLEGDISFEGLLHFGENVAVALASSRLAIGFRNKARLRIIPQLITGAYSGMTIYNGCNDRPGSLQGFVSHPLGGLQPANVLSYRFSGSGDVCGGVILGASDHGLQRMMDLLAVQQVKELLN